MSGVAASNGQRGRRAGELLADGDVVVLSGAGLSTDSGIPDYRGPTGSLRRHTPMTYQTFTRDPRGRHRYWARSYVGWRQIRGRPPNAGHRAVARAAAARACSAGVITQNVDGLHQAGGARDVVELHGGLDRTVCLGCGDVAGRAELDERLRAANPQFGRPGRRGQPRRRRRAARRAARRVRDGRLPGLRRGRSSPTSSSSARPCPRDRVERLLRPGRGGAAAAGARLVADRDVRLPVRAAGREARHPGRDRQPGPDPRRREADVTSTRRWARSCPSWPAS